MNEKRYEKRLEFQEKIISRQSKQIESMKLEIENLKIECQKKDEIIKSVDFLKSELSENVIEIKKYKEQYKKLIKELRNMKTILNQEVYRGKWGLIKFLIK